MIEGGRGTLRPYNLSPLKFTFPIQINRVVFMYGSKSTTTNWLLT